MPLFRKAEQAVGRNDTATAIQLFNQILRNAPGHNAAKLYLITLYDQVGRYSDALRMCDDLIRHYPEYIPVYVSKGNVAVKNRQYDLAAMAWEEALKRAPVDFPGRRETLLTLGQVYFLGARYADAKRAYTQALALDFDPVAGLACFYVLKAMRESEEGQPLLERVLTSSPPPATRPDDENAQPNLPSVFGQRVWAVTSQNRFICHDTVPM